MFRWIFRSANGSSFVQYADDFGRRVAMVDAIFRLLVRRTLKICSGYFNLV